MFFGQLATRAAHGQDALYILRRAQCPDFVHIALPAPEEEDEAAPMNWVLNPQACHYLLNVAPNLPLQSTSGESR